MESDDPHVFMVIDIMAAESYHIVATPGPTNWSIELSHRGRPVANAVFRLSDNPILLWILDLIRLHSGRR